MDEQLRSELEAWVRENEWADGGYGDAVYAVANLLDMIEGIDYRRR